MGYYTYMNAELKTSPDGERIEETSPIYKEVDKWFTDLFEDEKALEDVLAGENLKWYEVDEDMEKFAKEFPDVYFILWGEGEEQGDVWVIETYQGEFHKDCADYTPPQTYFG
jgi:hypothetical protein